jgi:hypothetical protein
MKKKYPCTAKKYLFSKPLEKQPNIGIKSVHLYILRRVEDHVVRLVHFIKYIINQNTYLCFFLFSSCFAFGIDSSILDTNTKPTAITTIATINDIGIKLPVNLPFLPNFASSSV